MLRSRNIDIFKKPTQSLRFLYYFSQNIYIVKPAYIDIHSHQKISHPHQGIQSFNAQDLLSDIEFPEVFSLGLHPWNISNTDIKKALPILDSLSDNPQLVAIGECGLDRAVSTNFETQKEVFISQLRIANNRNKAIIVHCVRAFSDILSILKEEKPSIPIIFHAYSGNADILQKLIKYNTYFSCGHDLFDERSKANRIINHIPLNRLFLETDDWNGSIEDIYDIASKKIGKSLLELRHQIYYTYKSLIL